MSPLIGLSGFGGGASRFGGVIEPSDEYFKYVSLLLDGNGTNGAQNNTFLDSSSNNFTITRNGNTTQGSFSPYNYRDRWSNYFDGTGDYLTNTSSALITQNVNTFTVESWIYMTENPTQGVGNITLPGLIGLDAQSTDVTNYLCFGPVPNRQLQLYWYDGGQKYCTANTVLNLNQWYHIACVVNNNTIKFYVNGVEESLSGTTTLTNRFNSISNFSIGSNYYGNFIGYVSNLRVTTTAVYTSAFTPPVSPLTAIANTRILTCQSNLFIDKSTNAFTLTPAGDVSVQRFSPIAPSEAYRTSSIGGSGYFDGSGDYLSLASNSAFGFGSGDFTMECWFYKIGTNLDVLIDTRIGAGGNINGMALYVQDNILKAGNNAERISGGVINTNSWNHCALVRSGNNLYLYLNGTRTASVAFSTSQAESSSPYIGTSATSEFTRGYISDVRLLKGTAQYTGASYTVPTSPLNSITNTSLLCNFTNAGIFDKTAINDLETQGNAQISTSVKKYDTGSLYFDGSDDRVSIINTPLLNFGSGDFTIECWVYSITPLSSYSAQYAHILGKGNGNNSGTYSLAFYQSKISFSIGSTLVQGSSTLTNNTWYHFAVTRSGTTLRLFVNGTLDLTTTNSTVLSSSFSFNVGDRQSGDLSAQYPLNGYVDDLRVTRVARYTANFTPPTKSFPVK